MFFMESFVGSILSRSMMSGAGVRQTFESLVPQTPEDPDP